MLPIEPMNSRIASQASLAARAPNVRRMSVLSDTTAPVTSTGFCAWAKPGRMVRSSAARVEGNSARRTPSCSAASQASTPAPPDTVTMATRGSGGDGAAAVSTRATSIISLRDCTGTAPHSRRKPSYQSASPALDAVWASAARAPATERPDFNASRVLPAAWAAWAAWPKASGSLMSSM